MPSLLLDILYTMLPSMRRKNCVVTVVLDAVGGRAIETVATALSSCLMLSPHPSVSCDSLPANLARLLHIVAVDLALRRRRVSPVKAGSQIRCAVGALGVMPTNRAARRSCYCGGVVLAALSFVSALSISIHRRRCFLYSDYQMYAGAAARCDFFSYAL